MKIVTEYNKFKEGSDKSTDFSVMLWWIIGDMLSNNSGEMTEEAITELKSFEHGGFPPQELKDFCEHLMAGLGWEETQEKFPEFVSKYPALSRALAVFMYS